MYRSVPRAPSLSVRPPPRGPAPPASHSGVSPRGSSICGSYRCVTCIMAASQARDQLKRYALSLLSGTPPEGFCPAGRTLDCISIPEVATPPCSLKPSPHPVTSPSPILQIAAPSCKVPRRRVRLGRCGHFFGALSESDSHTALILLCELVLVLARLLSVCSSWPSAATASLSRAGVRVRHHKPGFHGLFG